jgi:dienelactone hydrolase
MIEIWYPAETAKGYPRARFRDGRTTGFNESSLSLVKTRSFVSAPIATSRPTYPVLLFSGPVNRFQNTFEVEEMASNGFIVIGIDHPYDSDLVIFPDGRRVYRNDQTGYLDYTSEAAYQRSKKLVARRLAVRVADAQFVLDQLENWNDRDRSSRFFGRMDMRHIGVFGHSFGGAEAAELCRLDLRVGAGVNMDGTIFGTAKAEGIPKPYLVMFEGTGRPTQVELETGSEMARQQARDDEQDYEDVELTLSRYGGYFLQIPGVSHMDFTDNTLVSQLKARSGSGTLNVRRVHEMINRVTLEFFRRELLRDRSASVEAAVHNYPETVLTDKTPSVDRNKQWE